MKQQEIHTFTQ